ncbi:hypothetical protein AVEN_129887-1 [Araneus ventricosus]|uniref:Uncharacterized protein n=1 Tax=Araneus ventricosus TaxID=182803 RepID=A0A4Y2MPU5_ARAVE|nr:hypothetical protein AVEN_129887-1 [Araneus ventricosus]
MGQTLFSPSSLSGGHPNCPRDRIFTVKCRRSAYRRIQKDVNKLPFFLESTEDIPDNSRSADKHYLLFNESSSSKSESTNNF